MRRRAAAAVRWLDDHPGGSVQVGLACLVGYTGAVAGLVAASAHALLT